MNPGANRPAAYDPLPTLLDSPDSYPQKLDFVRSCILQIELDEPTYRAASFLDDRILGPGTRGAWLPIERIAVQAQRGLPARPLHFILHTGHVGSTLLSRLLDTTGSVLSLREPLPLRTLAEAHDVLGQPESLVSEAQFERVLDTFARLWSRGYTATRCVVLKATSAAARVAPRFLQLNTASRAVYLNLRAEPYLATLLAGANSPVDLRGHAVERMRRLRTRIGTPLAPLHTLTPGELTALSWLAESLTRREILDQWPERVLAVDFDLLLGDLPRVMGQIVGHLLLPADPGWLAGLGSNPALARYSKSPDHDYSPALRAQVLDQARRDHLDEIRRGIDWLASLARTETAVARVLEADSA
jgi:hypothetical protein